MKFRHKDTGEKILAMVTELATAKTQLDDFFELASALCMIVGVDGVIIRVNPAWERELGYKAWEMQGRHYSDFLHEDVQESEEVLAATAKGESYQGFENTYVAKDGTRVRLSWYSTPPKNGAVNCTARVVNRTKGT